MAYAQSSTCSSQGSAVKRPAICTPERASSIAGTSSVASSRRRDWSSKDSTATRLPAGSADQAALMVQKIIAYESSANSKTWEKDVLLVADDRTEEWEAVFETMNNDAMALVPLSMNTPFEGYLRIYEAEGWDLNAELVAEINAGALMVNYSGHGSYSTWADEHIFTNADATALTNTGKLPLFVSMSCLTGYFINTAAWDTTPLVETLMLAADKGAVASFMPTGMTTTEGQHILNRALFEEIFSRDQRELGEAIANAKMTLLANGDTYYEEISRTFLLFGDPAMQLKVPIPGRPSGLVAEQDARRHVALSWQAAVDADGGAVEGYHVYRKTAADAGYSRINSQPVPGIEFADEDASAGTRHYYVVRSVDADGLESVDSESASIVIPVTTSLGGSGEGTPRIAFCFISSIQDTLNVEVLALFCATIFIGMLATRRKPRG